MDNWKQYDQMEIIQKEFEQSGIICLSNFFPSSVIIPIRQRIYASFEKRGVRKSGQWQYGGNNLLDLPASEVKVIRRELKKIQELRAFDNDNLLNLASKISSSKIDTTPAEQKNHWQILITLPDSKKWVVPHSMWHLDFPRLPNNQLPGIQMFTFLDSVKTQGGGTLFVSGSHRLLHDQSVIPSKEVKKRLKREDSYFAKLFCQKIEKRETLLLEKGKVGNVDLRIIELTGEPGDLYLADLRLLHTVAPNASDKPRLMLTNRFFCQNAIDLWRQHISEERISN